MEKFEKREIERWRRKKKEQESAEAISGLKILLYNFEFNRYESLRLQNKNHSCLTLLSFFYIHLNTTIGKLLVIWFIYYLF